MDQACCSSQDPALGQPDPDSCELQVRVDFFRKLGYSATDVRHVLTKLGLSTDTNSLLGELVRTSGSSVPLPNPNSDERGTGEHKDPPVAPALVLGPHRRATPPPPLPLQQEDRSDTDTELKPIVIDGSNVAMSHGNKEVFSCRGIQLAVNYFLDRGHATITVFVPTWRKEQPRPDAPIKDQHILTELEKRKIVVFTPSRRVGGKRVVCYDDRFIVKLAYESDGVIVSNDTYRDLQGERPEWKKCIEERLLMYSFVNDKFMPPDDPLGRHGPSLDNFLRKKPLPAEHKRQLCPYDKKCTYGIKCKFYHPERAKQSYRSLADELRENARNCRDVKEERNLRLLPRGSQSDSGSSHNPFPYSLEYELGYKLSLDQRIPLNPGQVSENTLLYRDGHRPSQNHTPGSTPGSQWQKSEWSAMHSVPDRPYASISSDYLDSGLGSYESQCSEISHGHSQSYRLQQQQAFPSEPRYNRDVAPPCRCCSHVAPSVANQCNSTNVDPHSQPRYDTYSPHMYPPSIRHAYSLPSQPLHSGNHHNQQKCRSDPFQWLPQPRSAHSLPGPVHSTTPQIPSCYYGEHGHHTWAQPQRPSSAAFGPERLELRKNLQAIFSPQQVDTVMEMFPNQMNAQKLAAEILNMKAHGGIF